jgi:hypothetical protein
MSSVVISGDTSGAITLSAPAVAGTNTITLPAATGTVVLTGTTPTLNGITFPATQVPSADANTLDDYEEGTWTPTITTNSGTATTYSDLSGRYTRIGNTVYIRGGVRPTNGTFGAGSACVISGLPFDGGSQSPRAGTFSGCNASLYTSNQLAIGAVESSTINFVMTTAITLNNLFTFSGTYSLTAS